MPQLELVPLTQQEDFDFQTEDKIVRNTVRPTLACLAALERIRERMLWRGRFKSFDDYCKQRVQLSASTVNRQIGAEKVRAALPIGKLQNDAQAGALGSFPSSLHVEIIENVEAEAGGNPITAAMIERIGRRVYEQHNPFLFSAVKSYEDEDGEDEDEDTSDASDASDGASASAVNRAVANRTARPVLHLIIRLADHVRQGWKKGKKWDTPEDLCIDNLRDKVEETLVIIKEIEVHLTEMKRRYAASE